ncbi:MAG TPA: substrate-binding domain-containing protein [Candidatus Acidoferrum sp.]|nr:substrate-binding domain-containing protein [Candidatus Acidoferrum sp.]
MLRSLLGLTLFVFLASIAAAQGTSAVIHISGDPSMGPCTQRLTEWYRQNHPNVSFAVSGTRVNEAVQSMVEGKTEIVQSSREVLGGEITALRERRNKQFVQIPIATEVVGILVHPSNPVRELSIFDLRQILSGAIKNWKQVGGKDAPIKVYGRDATSDIGDFIETEYMGDASISSSVKTLPKNGALYAAVSADPEAIGYASVNLGLSAKVRFIAIKASASAAAIAPTTDTITSHKYPLIRQLYYIFAGEPSGELQHFAEWVLSQQGQLVVEANEMWPLGSADRDHGKTQLAGR